MSPTRARTIPPAGHARPLRAVLLGAAFLGAVAMLSLPAVRTAASPIGPLPLWLLAMPLTSLAALALADRLPMPPRGPAPSSAGPRRRPAPQARRRAPARPRRALRRAA